MTALLRTEVELEANGVVVIRCMGELDMSVVGELAEAIEWSRTADLRVLRIDTSGLEFIDSSGLHCLLDARKRCDLTGVRMELVVGPAVQKLLEISGAVDHFTFHPAVPVAVPAHPES
jgi:anti-sigma B factor antagonist